MLTLLFDGIAYGMVLFLLACGLSVTLGLMNLVNLAHGAFAMVGGYVAVIAVNGHGLPFPVALLAAALAAAAAGLALERTLFSRLYGRGHLEQVLFSIGIVFMAVAAVDYAMGAQQQIIALPGWLRGRVEVLGASVGVYRAFVIAVGLAVAAALQLVLSGTRFGSRLRAAVDNRRVARGLGIPVDRIFAVTFAAGSGLAGLGGALGIEIIGLDPTFPLKFLIHFLIVVAVGGTTTIAGPFLAALLLGMADVAGKYYVPDFGAFVLYTVMILVLVLRPQGLFAPAR